MNSADNGVCGELGHGDGMDNFVQLPCWNRHQLTARKPLVTAAQQLEQAFVLRRRLPARRGCPLRIPSRVHFREEC